jgi:hypothetical protein
LTPAPPSVLPFHHRSSCSPKSSLAPLRSSGEVITDLKYVLTSICICVSHHGLIILGTSLTSTRLCNDFVTTSRRPFVGLHCIDS